jgi:DNA helicase-2/ATP-dependent DNA helicase PcrA
VCGKKVTVGVMARVEELADRQEGDKGARWRPYRSLIPLPEIIGEALKVGAQSKRVQRLYREMLDRIGGEFAVLLDAPLETIHSVAGAVVAEGVRRVRTGAVTIAAGYDGEFGRVRIFTDEERKDIAGQVSLFEGVESMTTAPMVDESKDDAPRHCFPSISACPAVDRQARVAERPVPFCDTDGDDDPARPRDLNAAQWQVVCHDGAHLLIAAGPGTGKTHTITRRIARLAGHLTANERILAVTFTTKAAHEMRMRLCALIPRHTMERVEVGTFHRFCLNLLRDSAFGAVLPDCYRIASSEECLEAAARAWPDSSRSRQKRLLEEISLWKAGACESDAPEGSDEYHRLLWEMGYLDFDDLLVETLRLVQSDLSLRTRLHARYRFVFVDEYQDVNPVQHRLLSDIVGENTHLCAIGDPNQAIYGFRGASAALFERFVEDFPGATLLPLTDTYRCGPVLVAAGAQVIAGDSASSHAPPLVARACTPGRLVVHAAPTDKAEAEYVVHQIEKMVGGTSLFSRDSGRVDAHQDSERSFGDFAVLYRLNAQKRLLIEAFQRSGIPFEVSGETALGEIELVATLVDALHVAFDGTLWPRRWERVARVIGGVCASLFDEAGRRQAMGLADMRSREATPASVRTVVELLERLREKTLDEGVGGAVAFVSGQPAVGERLDSDCSSARAWETVERLARLHPDRPREFMASIALHRPEDAGSIGAERVRLMTLHAAKGLEFPVVFITGCEERLLPLTAGRMVADAAEERRLFYVGITRARERLFLVRSRRRSLYGETTRPRPSPFLRDIEERLKEYEEAASPPGRTKCAPDAEQLSLFS